MANNNNRDLIHNYLLSLSLSGLDARAHCSSALYHNNIMWPRLFIQIIHLYHEQELAPHILMVVRIPVGANTKHILLINLRTNIYFLHTWLQKLSYLLSV